jgi:hypothetical protein
MWCQKRIARRLAALPKCICLLIGGDKTGDKYFYMRMIPEADRLFDVHLGELELEGLI